MKQHLDQDLDQVNQAQLERPSDPMMEQRDAQDLVDEALEQISSS